MSDLQPRLDALIDDLLTDAGCPCRFPRFRAVVSRDTSKVAGGAFTSEDQRGLIRAFEKKVEVIDKGPLPNFPGPQAADVYAAKCARCHSGIERSSNEFANNAWIEYLVVRRAPGLVDLGAPVVSGRVFRCRPLVAAGPGMEGMAKAAAAYPFIEEDEWLEWMRERAPGAPAKA